MRVLKYSTEHLVCFETKDQKSQSHHQIFEKENQEQPVAIYAHELNKLHLSNSLPLNVREYKYFNEMGEIIRFLYSLPKSPFAEIEK